MSKVITTEFSDQANDQLIEETTTPNSLLTANQEKYLDDSCTAEKQVGLTNETAVEDNSWLTFNNESDTILKPKLISFNNINESGDILVKQRTAVTYYTVQMGDTVSTIARKFNISINTIIWANDLNSYGFIKPGNMLTILPYSGIVYVVKSGDTLSKIAIKYGIEVDKILSCNDIPGGLKIGQKIIVPGAKKLVDTSLASSQKAKAYTGISIIKDIIKSPSAKVGGTKMTWPTQGYRITQYYSWRHNGVDIGNKVGTPIYAADEGTVIIAAGGWNGGYGNTIVISHGNGKKTRYGHLSKLFVKVGDEVERGENIGTMGSTGRSTGPHLHFEVLVNSSRSNPLNYIR
jgi:LysM repeat protein